MLYVDWLMMSIVYTWNLIWQLIHLILVLFEADFLLQIGFSNKDFPWKNYKANNYKSVKSKVNLQFGYQIFTSLDFKFGITQNLQIVSIMTNISTQIITYMFQNDYPTSLIGAKSRKYYYSSQFLLLISLFDYNSQNIRGTTTLPARLSHL